MGRSPLSILLASDDAQFIDKLSSAATERGVALHILTAETDIDVELARHGGNVFIVDADRAMRHGARSATAFVARHPGIPVVLLAERRRARRRRARAARQAGNRDVAHRAVCSMI